MPFRPCFAKVWRYGRVFVRFRNGMVRSFKLNLHLILIDSQVKQNVVSNLQNFGGIIGGGLPSGFLISVCVPDACLASDVFGSLTLDSLCTTKEENTRFDGGDIAFM